MGWLTTAWEWLHGKQLVIVILFGSALGLLGAVGRERNAGRVPTRPWLLNRLFIMPLLASGSAAAAVQFELRIEVTCFLSGFLSLIAYEAIPVLMAWWSRSPLPGPPPSPWREPDRPTVDAREVDASAAIGLRDRIPVDRNSPEFSELLDRLDEQTGDEGG